jgi:glycosyltransferase involved in cell wall biosynthesis
VCWFVREVWPELKRRVPSLTFQIVGRNPTPAVQRLAQTQGVVVTGSVPDVRPYLAAAAMAVVPLRIARGVQNKVLEAMAMGRPVVVSPAATKGLDAVPGRELVPADLTGEWVDRILSLLNDVRSSSELGRLARECVVQRYNWAARLQPMVETCKRLAESPAPASGRSGLEEFAKALES